MMPQPSDSETPCPIVVQRAVTGLFFAAVILRAMTVFYTRFLYDDAFITFQYAHNLARGYGLVFQAGEKVLGTTSPLYAVILAVPEALRIPSPVVAPWLNLLLDLASVWLLLRWARNHSDSSQWIRFAVMAGFALEMLSPLGLEAGNGGMESALFRFLLVLFWGTVTRRWILGAFAVSLLMAATRPEGILFAGLILVLDTGVRLVKGERILRLDLLSVGIATLAGYAAEWALIALIYGNPLPVSIQAKLWYAVLLERLPQTLFVATDLPLRLLGNLTGITTAVLYIFGLGWLRRKAPTILPLVVVPLFYYPALARADVLAHQWYYVPALAFYYVGAACGFTRLISEDRPRKAVLAFTACFAIFYPLFQGFADGALPGIPWVMPMVAVFNAAFIVAIAVALGVLVRDPGVWFWGTRIGAALLVLWILIGFWKDKPVFAMRDYATGYRETNRAFAEWVAETAPGATIAIGEIGYVAYGLPVRVLDMVGLVQPEVARYRLAAAKSHPEEAGLPEVIARFKPDFVALETHLLDSSPLVRNPYFAETYRRARDFRSRTGRSMTLFGVR
jgi:hypothetical protein